MSQHVSTLDSGQRGVHISIVTGCRGENEERERERERERESVWERECVCEREKKERVCLYE